MLNSKFTASSEWCRIKCFAGRSSTTWVIVTEVSFQNDIHNDGHARFTLTLWRTNIFCGMNSNLLNYNYNSIHYSQPIFRTEGLSWWTFWCTCHFRGEFGIIYFINALAWKKLKSNMNFGNKMRLTYNMFFRSCKNSTR